MNEDITHLGTSTGSSGYTPPHVTGGTMGSNATERLGQQAEQAKHSLQSQGEELKQKATEKGTEAVADLKAGAQTAVREAKDYGRSMIQEQKESLATKVQEYASAARAASERLRTDDDALAGPAERAASQLDRMSNYLRDKQPADLLDDIESLARRRPEIVFGGMFVAGLAAARFFKASRRSSHEITRASYVGSPSAAGFQSTGISATPSTTPAWPSAARSTGSSESSQSETGLGSQSTSSSAFPGSLGSPETSAAPSTLSSGSFPSHTTL